MSKKNKSPTPSNLLPLRHRLTELFWVLGPAFTRWAESHMHEKGLTPQRVRILVQLDNGPVMMSVLRNKLGLSATNITALVDALEKDKMVVRKSHTTDRRATLIAITPKAEQLMLDNCELFRERVAEMFSGFTTPEEEQLLALLLQVREALIERRVLEDSEMSCGSIKKKKIS